jgi:predicted negative regulator of RcsB-dependent stress response
MATSPSVSKDPVLNAEAFWFRYRREILALIAILVVLALAWGAYRIYTSQREAAAAAVLGAANSPQDYQAVIDKYNGTPAAASACLLLAEAQHSEKKFVESNNTLQAFIDKNPGHELVPAAKMAMASNLERLGKVDEALSLYQQIAGKYPKSYVAPLALMSQVPLLKGKNQPDAARRACETLLSQYGESFWAGEAMRELRTIKPTTAPAGAGPAGQPGAPPSPSTQVAPPLAMPLPSAPGLTPQASTAPKPN